MVNLADLQYTPLGEFVLPFALVFAIVYGVLEDSEVFKNKGSRLIISLVIAFFGASYEPLISLLWQYLGVFAGVLILLFIYAVLKKHLFKEKEKGKNDYTFIAVIAGIALILLATIGSGWVEDWLSIGTENVLFLGIILLVGIIIYASPKE